jgi:hypothetical protein
VNSHENIFGNEKKMRSAKLLKKMLAKLKGLRKLRQNRYLKKLSPERKLFFVEYQRRIQEKSEKVIPIWKSLYEGQPIKRLKKKKRVEFSNVAVYF